MDKQEYKDLASMVANGDMKAFAKLYETVYREMYYTAYYSLDNDGDTVRIITETVRNAFKSIGKLHSEQSFRLYMMKTLCTKIKICFKEYAAEGTEVRYDESRLRPNEDGVDIKQEFNRLPDMERMVAALYIGGRFLFDEIAQYTGLSSSIVKKKLEHAMDMLELD